MPKAEATLSVRWLFPFIRLTGADPATLAILQREGITLDSLVRPETRLRHSAVIELLEFAVKRRNNPALGLLAGEAFQPGDVGVLEEVARSCNNLRESIACSNRYMLLLHDAQESELVEQDDWAAWQLRTTDDVPQPPAANDFIVSGAAWFLRAHTGQRFPFREVHVRHEQATNVAEYRRVFDGAVIRYEMPNNAIVFDRAYLSLPMISAQRGLQAIYRERIEGLLDERKKKTATVSERVRRDVLNTLATGYFNMSIVAQAMGMSDATLRRRLCEEGTTFSEIVDSIRNELAVNYLSDVRLSIREVGFLLGYAHSAAFYKAVQRSMNTTPSKLRERLLRERG